MGESGSIAVVPGVLAELPDGTVDASQIKSKFEDRGLKVVKLDEELGREEIVTPNYYQVSVHDGLGASAEDLGEDWMTCQLTASESLQVPALFCR